MLLPTAPHDKPSPISVKLVRVAIDSVFGTNQTGSLCCSTGQEALLQAQASDDGQKVLNLLRFACKEGHVTKKRLL
jgi:hypothetical protein